MVIKLHTLDDVHGMLPKDTISVSELKRLVEEQGTYRLLGKKSIVMTDTDIRDFIDRISARRLGPMKTEPTPNEVGLAVWIGDPAGTENSSSVLVDWCPRGSELDLLDAVRDLCMGDARVIATVDMKYGDFHEWLAKVKADKNGGWDHGKWFFRTQSVMKLAQSKGA